MYCLIDCVVPSPLSPVISVSVTAVSTSVPANITDDGEIIYYVIGGIVAVIIVSVLIVLLVCLQR